MAPMLAAVLPLQLVCQLVVSGGGNFSANSDAAAVNQVPLPEELPKLPEGYVAYPDIGVAYRIHNATVSWAVARKLCFAEGSQLALIDTPDKLKVVINQRKLIFSGDNYLHVGIHKFDESWVSSSDGSPVSSSIPWGSGEPMANKKCVAIGREGYDEMYARECTFPRGYVCEIPIPKLDQTQ